MEDKQIIDLYWQRSEQAISETDRKYGHYCKTIAQRILMSIEDSEECVSDTWLRAWNAIPPERPSILKAFLGKITRNLSINRYEQMHAAKRGGGEYASALDEIAECVADPHVETWSADREVLVATLNSFLGSMKKENRIIFVKRYWYMQSVKEIAEELKIGESKVKMTLLRARNDLAERLLKEGIEV